jgi:hypothetical protein
MYAGANMGHPSGTFELGEIRDIQHEPLRFFI